MKNKKQALLFSTLFFIVVCITASINLVESQTANITIKSAEENGSPDKNETEKAWQSFQKQYPNMANETSVDEDANVTDVDVEREWQTFLKKFEYHFEEEQLKSRRNVFEDNLRFVIKHNASKNKTHTVSINKFAHLSLPEFMDRMTGYRQVPNLTKGSQTDVPHTRSERSAGYLPMFVDWTMKGAVTPVKDQYPCGCCWAFSATGALEGQHAIKTGNLVSLSEQNLIDCATCQYPVGCDGGAEPALGFYYVNTNGGINSEKEYPYEGKDDVCRYNNATDMVTTSVGYNFLKSGDDYALLTAVAEIGPISVGFDANHTSFQLYESGIYYEPDCGNTTEDMTHAMLVVGYGTTTTGNSFWKIKNSWGTNWGQNGYLLLARNRGNDCCISLGAAYPVLH